MLGDVDAFDDLSRRNGICPSDVLCPSRAAADLMCSFGLGVNFTSEDEPCSAPRNHSNFYGPCNAAR